MYTSINMNDVLCCLEACLLCMLHSLLGLFLNIDDLCAREQRQQYPSVDDRVKHDLLKTFEQNKNRSDIQES